MLWLVRPKNTSLGLLPWIYKPLTKRITPRNWQQRTPEYFNTKLRLPLTAERGDYGEGFVQQLMLDVWHADW